MPTFVRLLVKRSMINRTIIRLKVVQLLYAYRQSGCRDVVKGKRELTASLDKARELYCCLLMLIVWVTRHARETISKKEQVNRVLHRQETISHRFADNRLAALLEANEELSALRQKGVGEWLNDNVYLPQLYADIQAEPAYTDYMAKEETTFADDRELWKKLYKNLIMPDERLDDLIEEQSLYWNDDKTIIDTFVLKTIKQLNDDEPAAQQTLLPSYKDEGDLQFATDLFQQTIEQDERWKTLIRESVKDWDFNRLALMDVIIMEAALAEMVSFPLIPVEVTINEYVEIAKYYSTPRSAGYVNGILDHLARRLDEEGVIHKEF